MGKKLLWTAISSKVAVPSSATVALLATSAAEVLGPLLAPCVIAAHFCGARLLVSEFVRIGFPSYPKKVKAREKFKIEAPIWTLLKEVSVSLDVPPEFSKRIRPTGPQFLEFDDIVLQKAEWTVTAPDSPDQYEIGIVALGAAVWFHRGHKRKIKILVERRTN